MSNPRISLDQWLAFKTVVDEGSFARAAEALNKSQSAVSYAITQLNARLPQPALVQQGRRAVLSESGRVLYRRAVQLLREAEEIETVANSLAAGIEVEVTIAVDSLLNLDLLVCTFEEFSRAYPQTRLRILETALSGTTEALLERKADVVVSPNTPTGFTGTLLRNATLIPVAAPTHPLGACGRPVTEAELRGHRQIVLRDTGNRRTQDSGWLQASKRWTVSHFSNSIKMIRAGLGFGLLPRNWIEQELAEGSLCLVDAPAHMTRVVPVYLMLTNRQAAGPAARALHDLVAASLRDSPRQVTG